jgi:hypothetical protein
MILCAFRGTFQVPSSMTSFTKRSGTSFTLLPAGVAGPGWDGENSLGAFRPVYLFLWRCDIRPCLPQPERPIISLTPEAWGAPLRQQNKLFEMNILPVSPSGSRFCEDNPESDIQ